MIHDAEEHASEDETKRQAVRIRNEAEILAYSTEQTLKDHGESIPADDKERIESSLSELKDMLKADDSDYDEIRKASEKLSTDVYKIAELMYNSTSGNDSIGS